MAESGADTAGLARTSARVAVWAGVALVSGFAIDATIAGLFGVGISTDAFFIAATVPFALTAVLAASANQALVPLFNTWHEGDDSHLAGVRTGGTIGALVLMATGVAVAGAILAGVLPDLLASGASQETRDLASSLIALLFVMLIPRTVAESLRALLNSRFSFTVPAASPLILNGTALFAAILLSDRMGIRGVAVGYLLGSLAQVILLGVVAWRKSIPVRFGLGFNDPVVRTGLKLLALPTAATGMNIFARIFERFLASFLASGSITIVSYAWRILNAVGGTVFFRSVTVVLIPRLTRFRDDSVATSRILRAGVRVMLAISFPLMAFLVVFAAPAVAVLFERGEFSGEDTAVLGGVLAIYMLTLPFVGVTRALLTYFYSRLDMVTPFFNRLINTLTNVAFGAILVVPFGLNGLAMAYVLATIGSFVHAYVVTRDRDVLNRRMARFVVPIVAGSVAAVAAAYFVYWLLPEAHSTVARIAGLALAGVIWLAVITATFGVSSVDFRPSDLRRS